MEVPMNSTTSQISTGANFSLTSKDSNGRNIKYISENKNSTNLVEKEERLETNSIFDSTLNKLSSFCCSNDNCSKEDFTILATTAEVIGESETIERIAEMIVKCNNESNEINNPRTKKQLQVLLSRNGNEHLNICTNKTTSVSSHIIASLFQTVAAENDGTCDSVSKTISGQNSPYCKSVSFAGDKVETDERTNIKYCKGIAANLKCNDASEEKYDGSKFEEIENKLEEMFAGIEDEHLICTTTKKRLCDDNSNIEMKSKISQKIPNCNVEAFPNNYYKHGVTTTNKPLLPTKAAMKSTISFSDKELKRQIILTEDENRQNYKPFQHFQGIPLQKKLSIETDTEFLRLSMGTNKINFEKQSVIDDDVIKENSTSSRKLDSHRIKEIRNEAFDTPKCKIKKSNSKSCVQYKSNIGYNKRKKIKCDVPNIRKQQQQKLKQRRIQRFLPSDNDDEFEEKSQQTREIDNKNRSPFILVNNNGSVTVVNTFMQDDSNEKYPRSKKINNYVCERKTVKGCHSSTLSNRYDADTADTSWICVFCKIGPHKNGLGDLFGPYVISTDCSEYQSKQDLVEIPLKKQRTDVPILTAISTDGLSPSKRTVKHLNESSRKSHLCSILDMSEPKDDPIIKYTLGMTKISDTYYEIWIHEDCAIWAPNIFIIGSRLAGLEESTWNSIRHECSYCLKSGALLCCLQRDCRTMAHVPCARKTNWLLDESTFWARCQKHI